MQVVMCGEEVRKEASTEAERGRLKTEAAVLEAVAHPGMVQLLRIEPEAIVLRRVAGVALCEIDAFDAEEIAGLGAAVSTIVADLHDLGFAHGALDASHILVEEGGRPVLCSFGRSMRNDRAARQGDVVALASLLSSLFGAGAEQPRSLERLLVRAGRGGLGARELASALVRAVPGSRLPGTPVARAVCAAASAGAGYRRRLGRCSLVAATFCVLAVGASMVILSGSNSHNRRQGSGGAPAPSEVVPCPAQDRGCAPVAAPGGTVLTAAGRFKVDGPADVVVFGRWDCRDTATAAVLDPSDGQVWVYDGWATPSRPLVARPVATVAGASSLRVEPRSDGCDLIVVIRPGAASTDVDPERP